MKYITALAVASLIFASNAFADPGDGFGSLYAHGEVYRTFGVPAAAPMGGRDNIYSIVDGVDGQLSVSAVAPGDRDYHGGLWAVHIVVWLTEPYLLTSYEDVWAAYNAGDVEISRMFDADFRCPMLPGRPNH